MKKFWDTIFGLNDERTIYVEQEDLGKEKFIQHRNKAYFVKIPDKINKKVILRLKGLGKTRFNKTGDLLLSIWLYKAEDIHQNLWLSETDARNGEVKILQVNEKKITVVVPRNSCNGITLRLKGLGRGPEFRQRAPFFNLKRGDLLVMLIAYPDTITPIYGSFDMLSTEDMALEGWIYKKIDEVINKIGVSSFPVRPMQAGRVADVYNQLGWMGIFNALVNHLKLERLNIQVTKSDSIPLPGSCQKTVTYQNNVPTECHYLVTINAQFLDNPFSTAAIMAHELCHIVYSERIDNSSKFPLAPLYRGYEYERGKLEEERTVDLLTFLFNVSEFQLRAARDTRITFGYFHQELFERMQVIVARKMNTH